MYTKILQQLEDTVWQKRYHMTALWFAAIERVVLSTCIGCHVPTKTLLIVTKTVTLADPKLSLSTGEDMRMLI